MTSLWIRSIAGKEVLATSTKKMCTNFHIMLLNKITNHNKITLLSYVYVDLVCLLYFFPSFALQFPTRAHMFPVRTGLIFAYFPSPGGRIGATL